MTRWYRSAGDLVGVVLWTITTTAVLVLGLEQPVLRVVLVVPLVLFFPGYALLEALFPERSAESESRRVASNSVDTSEGDVSTFDGIDRLERFVLALVVSLGLVPLVAFVVNYTPYGLRLRPVVTAVAGMIVVLSAIGFARRLRLPAERRRRTSFGGWVKTLWSRYVIGDDAAGQSRHPLIPRTNSHRALNLLLVLGLLTLVGSVGYAALTPPGDDTGFTEAYLVTQTDTGEYTSENLPKEFAAGESQRLFVALDNQEHERVTYTVVVTLDGTELGRFDTTVVHGETEYVERQITPEQTGDSLPLRFFVYEGTAPERATAESAYRTVDLWISVE